MDFWKTILGLIRRKALALPLLAAAVGLAALTFFLMPARYVSSTTMVLTTPTGGGTLSQDPARPTGLTNPLLNFDEGLKTAATIIIHAMNTPQTMTALGVRSGGATKVTIDDGRSNLDLLGKDGPFVYIEGDSTSPAAAREVVVRAQELVRTELDNRQKALGAPPSTFIKLNDVVPPSEPQGQLGAKWQSAGMAFFLCVALGLAGAYTAHRLRERRSPNDAGAAAEPGTGESLFEAHEPATNGAATNGARRWPARLSRGIRDEDEDDGSGADEEAPAQNGTPVKPDGAGESTVAH